MTDAGKCLVILLSGSGDVRGEGLAEMIRSLGHVSGVEPRGSVEELLASLRRPASAGALLVLKVERRQDLDRLVEVKDLLDDHRVVVLLPDNEPETLRLAHMLRPRYLGEIGLDPAVLVNIIDRMTQWMCVRHGRQSGEARPAWDSRRGES